MSATGSWIGFSVFCAIFGAALENEFLEKPAVKREHDRMLLACDIAVEMAVQRKTPGLFFAVPTSGPIPCPDLPVDPDPPEYQAKCNAPTLRDRIERSVECEARR